jgi:hypothetical protein
VRRHQQQERVEVAAPLTAHPPVQAGRPAGSVAGGDRAQHGPRSDRRPGADGRDHRLVGGPQPVRVLQRDDAAAAITALPGAAARSTPRWPGPNRCVGSRNGAATAGTGDSGHEYRTAPGAPPCGPGSADVIPTGAAAAGGVPVHITASIPAADISTAASRRSAVRPVRRRRPVAGEPSMLRPCRRGRVGGTPATMLWTGRRRCGQLRVDAGCGEGLVDPSAYARYRTSTNEVTSRVRVPVRFPAPGSACGTVPGRSREPRPAARRRHVDTGPGSGATPGRCRRPAHRDNRGAASWSRRTER